MCKECHCSVINLYIISETFWDCGLGDLSIHYLVLWFVQLCSCWRLVTDPELMDDGSHEVDGGFTLLAEGVPLPSFQIILGPKHFQS